MKSLLSFIFTISFTLLSTAQCDIPAPYQGNTGANMTLMLTTPFINSLNLEDSEAYLIAVSSSGLVVGSANITGVSQTSIAIWGNDNSTNELDGATANEAISFQLVDGNNIYNVEMSTTINYTTNGLAVQGSPGIINPFCIYGCTSAWAENFNEQATDNDGSCYLNGCMDALACNYTENATIDNGSCTLPGCTDNSYTEYYLQGFIAGCDDGSCSKATADLGIDADYFTTPVNTGANMTLGLNLSNTTGLEGSTIAAFSDLNNDGVISECVGLSTFQDGFFSLALWGDDASTPEIEGLSANEVDLIFAVLNSSGNVMAFNPNPEFTGYTTNGLIVITELDFNVTIYGCMDASYCNYNEAAEEDDGSCLGNPGCIDDHYVEFDVTASCSLEGSCATSWENAYEEAVQNTATLQSELDMTILAAEQATIDAQNELNATIEAAEQEMYDITDVYMALDSTFNTLNELFSVLSDNYETLNANYDAMELDYIATEQALQSTQEYLDATIWNAMQDELLATELLNNTITNFDALELDYQMQIEVLAAPILIDIIEGWNIIGYTRQAAQDAVATLDAISEQILIVKNNDAEVYWPEFGFNGIGDLIPGQGYQVKTNDLINDYFFPDTQGERLNVSPTAPQWVIDLPTDVHPNDIRSLVKVVNMLGQEVNPEDSLKGTTLI
jgi:hypothetical protein